MLFNFGKPKKLPRELIWEIFINEEDFDGDNNLEFDDPFKRCFTHPLKVLNMRNDIIMTPQMKFKYLNYLPKPIHIDESLYDLVDDDEFFKRDNRMPLVMVTQFGIFPTKGQYSDKPKKGVRVLEGLENQQIAFFRRTYLTNNEKDGLVILYADEVLTEGLVEDQKTFVSNINCTINKNKKP